MPGLMDALASSTAMTPPGAMPAAEMMGQQGAGVGPMNFNGEDQEGEPNVSPEEQAQYDAFVQNAMKFIYTDDGKVLPDLMKRLKAGEPVEALSQALVWVVMMVENSAKSGGQEIADDVLYHAGSELLSQMVEVVEATGYHDFSEDDISKAWHGALDIYAQSNTGEGGRVNPEMAAQDITALKQAENEGRANEIIPNFDQIPQRMFSSPDEEEEEM